jgi:charged multivesicular body protein 7
MDSKSPPQYPKEWSDDQVMDVLFSPFRNTRYVNPRSWDTKMKFWSDMVHRQFSSDKRLVFNARQLPMVFERNGKLPTCMNVVLEDLVRSGTVKPVSEYVASAGGWMSWSINLLLRRPARWGYHALIKQPVSWAFSKIFGSTEEDASAGCQPLSRDQLMQSLPDEEFVIVELVKKAADAVYERHCSSVTFRLTDDVVGYADLAQRCADICADRRSFDITLLELCRQKRCAIGIGADGEKVIRMASDRSERASSLSDTDMKIYRLKAAEAKLEDEIKNLTGEMEQCRLHAKTCLQQGRKSAALKYLRRKKLLDSRQHQHEQAIDKINSLLNMLQQTESQKQILDAYATGVEAFKEIKNRYGLTEDSIDDTMVQIQEAFDDNEIIQQSMVQPLPGDIDIDDVDLEQELDQLLAGTAAAAGTDMPSTPLRPTAANDKTVPPFDLSGLPSVPQHLPSTSPLSASARVVNRLPRVALNADMQ